MPKRALCSLQNKEGPSQGQRRDRLAERDPTKEWADSPQEPSQSVDRTNGRSARLINLRAFEIDKGRAFILRHV